MYKFKDKRMERQNNRHKDRKKRLLRKTWERVDQLILDIKHFYLLKCLECEWYKDIRTDKHKDKQTQRQTDTVIDRVRETRISNHPF